MCKYLNCSIGFLDMIFEKNIFIIKFNIYNFFNFVLNMICYCDLNNKLNNNFKFYFLILNVNVNNV